MQDAIHRELQEFERRESHQWILACALMVLLAAVLAGREAFTALAETSPDAALSRVVGYRVAVALFFLTVLFCLYGLHIRLLNGSLKNLLAEMSGLLATSMKFDDFLPTIARQIAETTSVDTCRIALLNQARTALSVVSEHAGARDGCRRRIGTTHELESLALCRRAVDTRQPVFARPGVGQRSVDRVRDDLATGGANGTWSVLIVPMVRRGRLLGLIILGRADGILARGFKAPTVAMTRTLAGLAAGVVDQAALEKEAVRDPLTGLYNRRHFGERLRQEMARADRSGQTTGILLCDLDRFKRVNDTLGHPAGDAVLQAVAAGIQANSRRTDTVFRWGGDEFVVILSNTSRHGARIAAQRLGERVRQAVDVDVDVSVGIALYPEHGHDEGELIRVADLALYTAKKTRQRVRMGESTTSTP